MTDFRVIKHCALGRPADEILSSTDGTDFWYGCPIPRVNPAESVYEQFDDFTSLSVGDATSKWTLDNTNGTVALASAEAATGVGGVIDMSTGGVLDNDFANLKISTTDTGAPFRLLDATTGRDLWFAARIYVSSIAANTGIYYIGLFNPADIEVGADNTGARNMTDGIYFRNLAATPTEIDWACTLNSTETEIQGAASTLAATTWIILAFKYVAASRTVIPYVNGTQLNYPMSTTITNFPDDQGLTAGLFVKTGDVAGAVQHLYVDWIKVVQKRLA